MSAIFSHCGQYRYRLTRRLPSILRRVKPITFVMLNPSTADAEADDPTICRCINFAKREGATHMDIVNLFALRSNDQRELSKRADPVGPNNDNAIFSVSTMGPVIVAWGAHPMAPARAERVVELLAGRELFCLGTNKDGSPKHPLYLRADTPLVPWGGES